MNIGNVDFAKIYSKFWNTIRKYVIFLLGISVGLMPFMCSEKFGKGLKEEPWIPSGGSDGCFYHGPTFIFGPPSYYYEYSIGEEDFRIHCTNKAIELNEIKGEVYVPRYIRAFIRARDFSDKENEVELYNKATGISIKNGLAFTEQIKDRITIYAYDRDENRAYIYFTMR